MILFQECKQDTSCGAAALYTIEYSMKLCTLFYLTEGVWHEARVAQQDSLMAMKCICLEVQCGYPFPVKASFHSPSQTEVRLEWSSLPNGIVRTMLSCILSPPMSQTNMLLKLFISLTALPMWSFPWHSDHKSLQLMHVYNFTSTFMHVKTSC